MNGIIFNTGPKKEKQESQGRRSYIEVPCSHTEGNGAVCSRGNPLKGTESRIQEKTASCKQQEQLHQVLICFKSKHNKSISTNKEKVKKNEDKTTSCDTLML